MATIVWGVVKQGLVIPQTPLPEGAHVQITLPDAPPEVTPEMQAEFDAWERASDEDWEMVERLASEGETDETR